MQLNLLDKLCGNQLFLFKIQCGKFQTVQLCTGFRVLLFLLGQNGLPLFL